MELADQGGPLRWRRHDRLKKEPPNLGRDLSHRLSNQALTIEHRHKDRPEGFRGPLAAWPRPRRTRALIPIEIKDYEGCA
jgi:hypothetical protein